MSEGEETRTGRGYVLTDTDNPGRTITVHEDDLHEYLGMRNNSNDGMRFRTRRGSVQGFETVDGVTRSRQFRDEELHALHGGRNVIARNGDGRHELAQSTAIRDAQRRLAASSPGLELGLETVDTATFGVPTRVAAALSSGNAADFVDIPEDIQNFRRDLRTENPASNVGGMVAGTALTLGVGGLARSAVSGGNVLRNITTTGLLGLSNRASARAAAAATARFGTGRAGQLAARVAHAGAGAATLDPVLSAQFNLAASVDNNPTLAGESVAAAAGTDVLYGWAGELFLPPAVRAIGMASSRAIKAASSLPGRIGIGALFGGAPGAAIGAVSSNMRRSLSNSARRLVSGARNGRAIRRAQEAAADVARLNLDDLSKLSDADVDGVVGRSLGRQGSGARRVSAEALTTARIRQTAAVLPGAAAEVATVGNNLRRHLTGSELSGLLADGARGIDYGQSSLRAADRAQGELLTALDLLPDGDAAKELQGLYQRIGGAKPSKVAEELLFFRAKLGESLEAGGNIFQSARDLATFQVRMDEFLTSSDVWSGAGHRHGALMALGDDLRGSAAALAVPESGEALSKMVTESVSSRGLGDMGGEVARIRQAVTDGVESGLLPPRAIGVVAMDHGPALARLTQASETVSALNTLRQAEESALGGLGRDVSLSHVRTLDEAINPVQEAVEAKLTAFDSISAFADRVDAGLNLFADRARTGRLGQVPAIGIMAYRDIPTEKDKREIFSEISRNIQARASNMEAMLDATEQAQKPFVAAQDIGDGLGRSMVAQSFYLADKLPVAPVDISSDPAYSIPITDIDVYLERFSAIQAPESLMYAYAEGTLTEESIDAVKTVYPELFIEMQIRAAQNLAELAEEGQEIPYALKVSSAMLLGNNIDPSMDAEFVLDLQSPSAQTQQQHQAMTGPLRSSREPSFARQAQTNLSRIERL